MAYQLSNLQNLCKRDPEGYRDEFLLQKNHFDSQLQIFLSKPSSNFESFEIQIKFLSHISTIYKEDLKEFPNQLCKLLEEQADLIDPQLRKTLVNSLIMLRNRNIVTPTQILGLFFKLFRLHDKGLRNLLYNHIVNDIKRVNAKHKDNKLNTTLQNFMFSVMTQKDSSLIAAKKSLEVMIELYTKNVWHDAKTVNAISQGVFSKNPKIVASVLKFFLTPPGEDDTPEEEDYEKQEELKETVKKLKKGHGKKTKRKQHLLDKANKDLKKVRRQAQQKVVHYNFPAIDLLYDPQSYTEKLFAVLKGTTEHFEVRLMMMNFVSRLIGHHKLLVENFYPFLQGYLNPKQDNITYILAILAQACHELVEPETLEPIVRTIAMHFVHDRCSPEAIAIGLNTIREVCVRQPLVMNSDLLQDLAGYKKHKDKGVLMATRSLINFFRQNHPQLLHRRDRGKDAQTNAKPLRYGEQKVVDAIEGIELLEAYKQQQGLDQEDELEEQEMQDGDEDDDEDGWQDVDQDSEGEYINISDEDEDEDGNNDEWITIPDDEVEEFDLSTLKKDNDDDEENEEIDEEEDEEEDADDDGNNDGWVTIPDDEVEEYDLSNIQNDEDNEEENNEEDNNDEPNEDTDQVSETSSQISDAARKRLDTIKILSQEELETLRQLKSKQGQLASKNKRKSLDTPAVEEPGDIVDPSDIIGYRKKQRATREEKVAMANAGREGVEHVKTKRKAEKDTGTTNEAKLANKPYMLVRYSRNVRNKKAISSRDKQKRKRAHVLTMKNQKKYKH